MEMTPEQAQIWALWIRAYGTSPDEVVWRRSWHVAEHLWTIDVKTALAAGTWKDGWNTVDMNADVILSIVANDLNHTDTPDLLPIAVACLAENVQRVRMDVLIEDGSRARFRNAKPLHSI